MGSKVKNIKINQTQAAINPYQPISTLSHQKTKWSLQLQIITPAGCASASSPAGKNAAPHNSIQPLLRNRRHVPPSPSTLEWPSHVFWRPNFQLVCTPGRAGRWHLGIRSLPILDIVGCIFEWTHYVEVQVSVCALLAMAKPLASAGTVSKQHWPMI